MQLQIEKRVYFSETTPCHIKILTGVLPKDARNIAYQVGFSSFFALVSYFRFSGHYSRTMLAKQQREPFLPYGFSIEIFQLEVWHLFVLIELLHGMEDHEAYIRKWLTRQANRYLSKCSLKWFNILSLWVQRSSAEIANSQVLISPNRHRATSPNFANAFKRGSTTVWQCRYVHCFLRSTSIFVFLREGFVYIDNYLGKEKLCP